MNFIFRTRLLLDFLLCQATTKVPQQLLCACVTFDKKLLFVLNQHRAREGNGNNSPLNSWAISSGVNAALSLSNAFLLISQLLLAYSSKSVKSEVVEKIFGMNRRYKETAKLACMVARSQYFTVSLDICSYIKNDIKYWYTAII